MTYKVYIESLNNFPIGEWGVSALLGYRNRQTDVIFFEDIEEVPVSPYNIVVGCIETTNKYFEKLGINPKMALNIPKELEHYLGRKIWRSTMSELRLYSHIQSNFPMFIKGDGKAKQFIPGVVKNKEQIDLFFKDVPDEEPILISEDINFVSEYRCYIINGEIKGIYYYLGDFFKFPDSEIIKNAVKDYKSAPAGYTMDFGITKDGRTLLIECNDGWSIGNYGLDPSLYVKLLGARWLELMKQRII